MSESESSTITFGPVSVIITEAGTGGAQWSNHPDWHRRYRVELTYGPHRYETDAWGSQHDYERLQGRGRSAVAKQYRPRERAKARREIGGMVADQLMSYDCDPDGFTEMLLDGRSMDRAEFANTNAILAKLDASRPIGSALYDWSKGESEKFEDPEAAQS